MNLLLNSNVSLEFSWLSFLKHHLDLILILKSEFSSPNSTSLIEESIEENPKPFSNTFLTMVAKTFDSNYNHN